MSFFGCKPNINLRRGASWLRRIQAHVHSGGQNVTHSTKDFRVPEESKFFKESIFGLCVTWGCGARSVRRQADRAVVGHGKDDHARVLYMVGEAVNPHLGSCRGHRDDARGLNES
jgi:hypothetical protein